MQPYQKATQEVLRQRDVPNKALGLVASGAAAYAGGNIAAKILGSGITSRILPLLNKHIPEDLAMKGLKKVDPKLHDFANLAKEYGNSFDSIKEFIEEKVTSDDSKKSPSGKNIIQKYSPELFQEITDLIQKGNSPIGAASSVVKKHMKTIKQIQKDYKVDWLDLVESIFGKGDIAGQGMQGQQQQMQQPQQGQQQAGNGNAMLLQAIQSINQRLGGQ